MSEVRTWKKVFETDLYNIISELKDVIESPATIILSGPLGAGKTTFTKYFIGESDEAPSPTYSIINEKANIAHADFYRIEDKEEIMHLELPLYLENKDFFIVEWGDKFLGSLKKEVDEKFKFYQLEISINDPSPNSEFPSRNYFLKNLS